MRVTRSLGYLSDVSTSAPTPASSSDEASELTGHRHSERMVTAYLAFLGVLLAFGIDVALPAFDEIRDAFDLEASGRSVSQIGTVYFLGMAAGQLIYGPVSDRFGRRPILLAGLALYFFGALGSALATSFDMLLAARLVWGLGAASSGALRTAVARDLYEGDRMARVTTIVMAVFMIGPIFVPIVGEGLLVIGSWATVFLAGLILAAIAAGWTVWFGETLSEANRRPLRLAPIRKAAKVVITTRQTMGHVLAQTFASGAFYIFLGSSQPILDLIYGRADQFVLFFAASGAFMVVVLLINNRLIRRYGARFMALVAGGAFVATSSIGLALTLWSDGRPSVWVWIGWVAMANALITTLSPMCTALALQPMGSLAGTASALLGFITLAGGALLAAVVDRMIDGTVTPMAVGYTVYALITGLMLVVAGDPSHATIDQRVTVKRS